MTPLQLAVLAILDRALSYEWSVQGFGVLRLYIRDLGRLHIWDQDLIYPNVSMIHTHSWDLRSTIVAGVLANIRYTKDMRGDLYHGTRLITGYHTAHVKALPDTLLLQGPQEMYTAGDVYEQRADEIHMTEAFNGTVTLMERKEDVNGEADVYWPHGTEWGTAKPRKATEREIVEACAKAFRMLEAS